MKGRFEGDQNPAGVLSEKEEGSGKQNEKKGRRTKLKVGKEAKRERNFHGRRGGPKKYRKLSKGSEYQWGDTTVGYEIPSKQGYNRVPEEREQS